MIPIPIEEYFDDEIICVECCCFIVEDETSTLCRKCLEEEDGHETEGEPAWSSYCEMEVETEVCY